MADYYCDHGAYHYSATATATASNSSTVTLASVVGKVGIGALLTGAGVPANLRVTGFGTGTGGNGTYTLSQTVTLSNVAVTITEGLPHATVAPNWGIPEEGDGVGKTPSTASATVDIDLSGATAAAGNAISVLGASLTCVASGATTNQFNAGSGATLVTNLVAAINRTTNTVTVAAQATGWSTMKVQDVVFARQHPTIATTLQIMTRAGSATYNGKTVNTSGITGANASYAFAGGVSGCWGHLGNYHANIFPSSVALYSYGIWKSLPMAGFIGAGDVVYVRSNKQIVSASTGATWSVFGLATGVNAGNATNFVEFLVDDGSQWPADGIEPVLKIVIIGSAFQFTSFGSSSHFRSVRAKKYSDSKCGLHIDYRATTSGGGFFSGPSIFNYESYEGIMFSCADYAVAQSVAISAKGGTGVALVKDCVFVGTGANFLLESPATNGSGIIQNCLFDAGAPVAPGVLIPSFANSNGTVDCIFENCRFVNHLTGTRMFPASYSQAGNNQIQFRDCSFGNVSVFGPITSRTQSGNTRLLSWINSAASQFGNGDFFIDHPSGFCDWVSTLGYPKLNATLLDGVSKWSMRVIPSTVANVIGPTTPLVTPRFSKRNTLGEGIRTATVQLAIEQSHAWTKRDVCLQITYVQPNGTIRVIDSHDPIGRGALDASTATWSSEQGGQVAFFPGPILFNKRKISLTTPTPVKANTDVVAVVKFFSGVADVTKGAFVDPDVVLS